jgi:arginyl-tRNA synthetase
MEVLEQTFKSVGLEGPERNEALLNNFARPLEVYRAYLVKIISEIVGCEEEIAQKCILWPNNIDNGDLAVVLPKLRPGVKADKTGVEIMEKVQKLLGRIRPFPGRIANLI